MKKVIIIGDIMSDYSQIESALKRGYDFVFEGVAPFLASADCLIFNLETPLSNDPKKFSKEKYSFCAPASLAAALKKINRNVVCLTANNHCLDRGIEGLFETINILDSLGISHTGTQTKSGEPFLIVPLGKMNLALVNYTYGTNAFFNHYYLGRKNELCVNLLQNQEYSNRFYKWLCTSNLFLVRFFRRVCVKLGLFQFNKFPYEKISLSRKKEKRYLRLIRELSLKTDFVLALLHVGSQYGTSPTSYTKSIAKKTLKNGASFVSCNHEHVIHGMNMVGSHFCSYSLGNFLASAGLLSEPFDEWVRYSISINLYFDDERKILLAASYSVFKTIVRDNVVCPSLVDLAFDQNGKPSTKELENIFRLIPFLYRKENEFYFFEKDA